MSIGVGDRVLVRGRLGTITNIEGDSPLPYMVGFFDGDWEVYSGDQVTLVAKARYEVV